MQISAREIGDLARLQFRSNPLKTRNAAKSRRLSLEIWRADGARTRDPRRDWPGGRASVILGSDSGYDRRESRHDLRFRILYVWDLKPPDIPSTTEELRELARRRFARGNHPERARWPACRPR